MAPCPLNAPALFVPNLTQRARIGFLVSPVLVITNPMTRIELETRILDIVDAAPLVSRGDLQGMVEALAGQVIKQ